MLLQLMLKLLKVKTGNILNVNLLNGKIKLMKKSGMCEFLTHTPPSLISMFFKIKTSPMP